MTQTETKRGAIAAAVADWTPRTSRLSRPSGCDGLTTGTLLQNHRRPPNGWLSYTYRAGTSGPVTRYGVTAREPSTADASS